MPEQPAPRIRRFLVSYGPLAIWGALVAIAAPSLLGDFHLRFGPASLLPLLVLAGALAGYPRLDRVTWRWLLVVAFVAAILWAVSLGLVDGRSGLTAHNVSSDDYLPTARQITDPGGFVDDFADYIRHRFGHVASHPPGFVLLLWLMGRAGLGGDLWAAALMIAGGAAALVAALVAVRSLAGEERARSALPFLVLSPAAVWMATSADAFFAGVTAWAVALFAIATSPGDRSWKTPTALLSGIAFGISVFLTYGATLIALIFLAIAVHRRQLRPLILAAAGALVVVGAFVALGFWWLEGLRATHLRYLAGVSRRRGYLFFLVANLGALGLSLSPAGSYALTRLRDTRVWILAGGALAAVAIADVTGMSKGEVERIWLLFVPWLLLATSTLGNQERLRRRWLVCHALTGIVVQTLLRSPW